MLDEIIVVATPLLLSLLMGSAVGLERAWHGRPAGLRTHTLVCMSSALLMLLTVNQWSLMADVPIEAIRIDPTRMAQGIMTGIGFLGAGVIMKEGLTVRGLTTAASIWTTASIGIMLGMGFNTAGTMATVLTLIVLSLFSRIEGMLPSRRFGRLLLRYKTSDEVMHEDIDSLIEEHHIKAYHPSYHLVDGGRLFEYEMTIFTNDPKNFHTLAERLKSVERLVEFSITPSGD
ncbi:MAG: MgtC/SapB family protein [Sulfuriflexus sp.]|nr:MgtC/SapB family protein [Sulfuriflexus sp.]